MNILHSDEIRHGYLLGLFVNYKLLRSTNEKEPAESVDTLTGDISALMQNILTAIGQQTDPAHAIKALGLVLYSSSLVHLEDPLRETTVGVDNPFEQIVDDTWIGLYAKAINDIQDDTLDEQQKRFKTGFGLARCAYNLYRMRLNIIFDHVLQAPDAVR